MSLIIAVEGTDGSGKFTQCTKLYEKLTGMGYKCKLQSFPCYDSPSSGPVKMYLGGEFGDSVASLDSYQASVLYATDRLCTMSLIMKDEYDIILLDRYTQSNFIHQTAKIKEKDEREKYLDWVVDFEFNILKLPRPDLVLFLDMPAEVSIKLAHARKELKAGTKTDVFEKDNEHLIHAYNNGKELCKKYGWKEVSCVDEKMNIKSIDQIHEDVFAVVKDLL